MRQRFLGTLALVAVVIVASCAGSSDGRTYLGVTNDLAFFKEVQDAVLWSRTVELRSFTDFPWDTVYTYYEAKPTDEVNAEVGSVVLKPGGYLNQNAAVFLRDGTPVKILALPEMVLPAGVKLGADAAFVNGRLRGRSP
jgi:hypothetical protein